VRHEVRIIPLYDPEGEVVDRVYKCVTHGCEDRLGYEFLKCVREDPDPEIELFDEESMTTETITLRSPSDKNEDQES